MRVGLIDLDQTVTRQLPLAALVDAGQAVCIDASDLAPQLRLVANKAVWQKLQERINTAMDQHSGRGAEVFFYGSGDFHHLTAGLIARHQTPVTVIHLDQHPDWVTFPRSINCGSWVNCALELPQVDRVITLGPSGDDLDWPEVKAANLRAVAGGRLVVWPWQHKPSLVFGRYGNNDSWVQKGRNLHWHAMGEGDLRAHLLRLSPLIRTHAVYITIDKDVLVPQQAVTNWDQGCMTLQHVEAILNVLGEHHQVIGIDVCGDYSSPVFDDLWRRGLSYFDRDTPRPPDHHHHLNAQTNAALLEMFRSIGA